MAEGIDFDFGEDVDVDTFSQILEMDDDETRDFSSSIVFGFIDQAEETFDKMDEALKEKNLEDLSRLGHFLKGSSATLGFNKIRDECEKIQHYGHHQDETGTVPEEDDEVCLAKIKDSITEAKKHYKVAAEVMKRFYSSQEQ